MYVAKYNTNKQFLAIDIMNYSLPYKKLFGGVSSMSTDHFKNINGYPNRYWGWGGKHEFQIWIESKQYMFQ